MSNRHLKGDTSQNELGIFSPKPAPLVGFTISIDNSLFILVTQHKKLESSLTPLTPHIQFLRKSYCLYPQNMSIISLLLIASTAAVLVPATLISHLDYLVI